MRGAWSSEPSGRLPPSLEAPRPRGWDCCVTRLTCGETGRRGGRRGEPPGREGTQGRGEAWGPEPGASCCWLHHTFCPEERFSVPATHVHFPFQKTPRPPPVIMQTVPTHPSDSPPGRPLCAPLMVFHLWGKGKQRGSHFPENSILNHFSSPSRARPMLGAGSLRKAG